jgi:hypothetical protein
MVTRELMNAMSQERIAEARRLQQEAQASKPQQSMTPRRVLSGARSGVVALPNFLARRFRTAAAP